MSEENLPKEVSSGKIKIADGLEIEAVLLDNGQTVITEQSMVNFLNWLEGDSPTIEGENA